MERSTGPGYKTVEQMLEYKYGIPRENLPDAFRVILWASSPSVRGGIVNADTLSYNIVPTLQKLAVNMGLGVNEYDKVKLPLLVSGVFDREFNDEFNLPFENLEIAELVDNFKRRAIFE